MEVLDIDGEIAEEGRVVKRHDRSKNKICEDEIDYRRVVAGIDVGEGAILPASQITDITEDDMKHEIATEDHTEESAHIQVEVHQ